MNVAKQRQMVGALPHGSSAKAALAVGAAVLILVTAVVTWIAFETLSTRTTGDAAQAIGASVPNSGLVEFRRGEQGASEVAAAGGTTLAPGLVEFRRGEQGGSSGAAPVSADPDPALVEFRRGERGDN